MRDIFYFVIVVAVSTALAGCGTVVPKIKEPWDADKPPNAETPWGVSATAQLEFEIKKRIYCDLRDAVKAANSIPAKAGPPEKLTVKQPGLIPSGWGAQLSLSLQVDEASSLNPGVALNTVLPTQINYGARSTPLGNIPAVTTPQSFSFGFGATASSTATRIDKFDPYYSIQKLMEDDKPESVCLGGWPYTQKDPLYHEWTPPLSSPFLVESDLGIKEWLVGAMMVSDSLPSSPVPPQLAGQPAAPRGKKRGSNGGATGATGATVTGAKDTVSLEIKFVIVTSGNVTPTWKLVRVSANTASTPFFNTGRTRTHDLIITIGDPSIITSNTHLASQIGNSVSNGNRAAAAAGANP